jgi:photosystem II stability/assembly factor-like uncharacterized protein
VVYFIQDDIIQGDLEGGSIMMRWQFLFGVIGVVVLHAASAVAEPVGWSVGAAQNGHGTIVHSTDGGATWTRQGLGQIANVDMQGVTAVDANTAWVVGYSDGYATIYRTTDGGTTWSRTGDSGTLPNVDLCKVTAWGADSVWAAGTGAILHSSDGGTTWTNQCPAEYASNNIQGIWTPDGQTIWAGGKEQYDPVSGKSYALVLKSTDGGQSWQRQTGQGSPNPLQDWNHVNGITAVDSMRAWAEGGGYDGGLGNVMLRTTDGGATWTAYDGGGLFDGNEIHAVDEQVIWAVNDSTIYRSLDGGDSWVSVGTAPNYTMGVTALSDQVAWACVWGEDDGQSFGEIHRTMDGGQTWDIITAVDGQDLPALWTIDFVPEPATATLLSLASLLLLQRRRAFGGQ